MAAKQGLSAQLSQASEDAKRAVLQRTSLTSSLWFSNLNTTCTIKSAPPRTPEVLSLLSSKSGWLFKRNEQHVWQSRWCCVVPHTFLYYFDANVLPGQVQPPVPTTLQQEDWNKAVKDGYGSRSKKHAPRSTLFFSTNYTGANSHMNNFPEEPEDIPFAAAGANGSSVQGDKGTNDSSFTSSLQPAGIIDLECYTAVHRSSRNELVMELAGDDTVNPDLRSFYFCSNSESETEDWTQAFLGQRHSALIDETEAYKQVCDGFAQQLQMLHSEMDLAAKQQEDAQEELYQVRSQMEELRRNAWKLVEETLERSIDDNNNNSANNGADNNEKKNCIISTARSAYRADLNTAKSQDVGHLTAIQLLTEYTRVLEEACLDLNKQNDDLQTELQKANHSDHERVQTLESELQQLKENYQEEKEQWQRDMKASTQRFEKTQKELQDVQKELASTRMEVTMYQSSTRNKLTELQNHKKILKREVIDLRQKLEDANSELNLVQHKQKTGKLEIEQDRKKMELLERYVEKMESQVKVQQNMMEMMSSSGVGSVVGGSVHGGGSIHGGYEHYNSYEPRTPNHNFSSVVLVNTPSSVQAEDDEVDVNVMTDKEPGKIPRPLPHGHGVGSPLRIQNSGVGMNSVESKETDELAPLMRRSAVDNDVDNKSHMSELTEDRTQKAFDAVFQREYGRDYADQMTPTGQSRPSRLISPRGFSVGAGHGPPSFIGVSGSAAGVETQTQLLQQFHGGEAKKLLDTISSPKPAKSIPSHLSQVSNSSSATPTRTGAPSRSEIPRSDKSNRRSEQDNVSLSSNASPQRLSVAQRARIEADRHTTPVKIRLNKANLPSGNVSSGDVPARSQASSFSVPSTPDQNQQQSSGASVASKGSTGFFSNIGKRLEEAIDKTVFASNESENDSSSDESMDTTPMGGSKPLTERGDFSANSKERPNRANRHGVLEEKKTSERAERTEKKSLTLLERQQLQRAQQMKFLKNNGIIRDESDVRGGAGASPSFADNSSDVSFVESTLSFPGISSESPKRSNRR